MNMQHRGTVRFMISAIVAGFATLAFKNSGQIPDDWKQIATSMMVALVITFCWFLVRGVQKNKMSIPAIIGAVVVTGVITPVIVGWIVNIISHDNSFSVDIMEIISQYAITLAFAVVAKLALTPDLLEGILVYFIFDED